METEEVMVLLLLQPKGSAGKVTYQVSSSYGWQNKLLKEDNHLVEHNV